MKANHFCTKSLSNRHISLPKQPPKATDTDNPVIDLILHCELILQSTTSKGKTKNNHLSLPYHRSIVTAEPNYLTGTTLMNLQNNRYQAL